MKPARSRVSTVSLSRLLPNATPAASVSSLVVTQPITSSSVITCTGLKKCRPRKRSGRAVAAAWSITGSDEVLVANSASGAATASTSRHISSLASRRSVIASITRSQPASSE